MYIIAEKSGKGLKQEPGGGDHGERILYVPLMVMFIELYCKAQARLPRNGVAYSCLVPPASTNI